MRGLTRKISWGLFACFLFSVISAPVSAQQCVPYARNNSTIFIRGDAWTWWKGAEGKYAKSSRPEAGSVLVFQKTKKMRRGHVAVIKEVIDSRKIVVDHANWAPRGSRMRGKEAKSIAIIDVSPKNDWSSVRVWYKPLGDFGARTYPTYGFIHDRSPNGGKVKNARFAPAPSLDSDVFDDNADDGETTLTAIDENASSFDAFGPVEKKASENKAGSGASDGVISASYTADELASFSKVAPSAAPSVPSSADGEMSSEVDSLAGSMVVAYLSTSTANSDIP
jgi:surface antigen